MACAAVNILNPSMSYCLQSDFIAPAAKVTFYAGLDHEGDDIRKTNNIFKDDEPNAVAYNTLGYYKHSVNVDGLKCNRFINKENGHGIFVKTTIKLTDANFLKLIKQNLKYFNVLMDGYFQFCDIFLQYKPQILEYIAEHKSTHYIETDLKQKILMEELLDDIPIMPEHHYDIVIHIRLDDFKDRPDYIEATYYLALFKTMDFSEKKTCLLCDGPKTDDERLFIETCVQWFKEREMPIALESNSLMMDFNIMKQAKILVCSMSTLSWTAAYLSTHIQQCYMPNYDFSKINHRKSLTFKKPIENTHFYPVKTTIFANANIKPFILTLPQYSSRLEKLSDLRDKLSFIGMETTLYNGVCGKEITTENTEFNYLKLMHYKDSTYMYDSRIRSNKTQMKRGEFGCAWSHLNLLKQLTAETANVNYYLILEDDVELIKPIDELNKLLQNIPEDTDMCHLAKSDWFPFMKTRAVNAYFTECVKAYFNRTTAYLISKAGAKKVLNYINNHIDIPIDDVYNVMHRETHDFRFYVPVSDYFFQEQPGVLSTIHDINGN
jgi:GR25 family glycosyltransferase involved in LPS biosynthesis